MNGFKMGFRRPKSIPKALEKDYIRWKQDPEKYERMYPVLARIIKEQLKKEGLYEETRETDNSDESSS